MIRNTILIVLLGITGGCQFCRNVIVDDKGTWFPWHANRDNSKYIKKWNEDKKQWELEDAGRRIKMDFTAGSQDF